MLRSMFAGVSGLRSHQTMLDVVGNNISNVNTAGYKGSRATFADALSQAMRGASGLGEDQGGINPMQVGLGSQTAAIDGVFTQGSVQSTGRATDLAIQGEGFFVVGQGDESFYTRAGAFTLDEAGTLTGPGGARVMGWMPNGAGEINTEAPLAPLQLPMGQVSEPRETGEVVLGGNLPAAAADGDTVNTSITVYDSLGDAHQLRFEFEKQAGAGQWQVDVLDADGNLVEDSGGNPVGDDLAIEFDTEGALDANAGDVVDGAIALTGVDLGDGEPQDVTLELQSDRTPLVQFGDDATAEARSQDGMAMGFLRDFDFGADGSVNGRFSNGESEVIGQVALATFNNPGGLSREGESLFSPTVNSGEASVVAPGGGGSGTLTPGALEMSNVDLAEEFTNLIVAQRGFQANSRSITAGDEVLQELINLKR